MTIRLALSAFMAAALLPMAIATSPRADDVFDTAEVHIKRCLESYQAEQYARGVPDCDEAARLKPSNADYLNMACYMRAISGDDLGRAIDYCNRSLRLDAGNINTLDSRGLAFLKAGVLDRSIADYDAVLARQPQAVNSLYGRGVARLRRGDNGGSADLAAAKAIDKDVAKLFATFGIEPPPNGAAAASSDPCALAAIHWQSTESIHTLSAYRDHLARFPTCTFADLARARIATLTRQEPAPKAASAKPPRAKARSASAPSAAQRPSGQLDCSRPGQWAACANRALSTVPGLN